MKLSRSAPGCYFIQNVKDGIQIPVYKINNECVTHFSQFILVKVKENLRKSQVQFRKKLRKIEAQAEWWFSRNWKIVAVEEQVSVHTKDHIPCAEVLWLRDALHCEMPPLSLFRGDIFISSSTKSRRMLLELLNNRRLLSEASRHVASLSSVTRLFSCSRDTGCFHLNRKPEHILCSPSFPVSLRTLKYNDLNLREVLKKHYNTDSSLHQVRKGDNKHDIVESSEAITGQLTVGQKGCFSFDYWVIKYVKAGS